MNKVYTTYVEPFVGAGSIFFNLDSKKSIRPIVKYHGGKFRLKNYLLPHFVQRKFSNYILSDLDENLISLYKVLKDDLLFNIFNTVISEIDYSEEKFLWHKNNLKQTTFPMIDIDRAISYFCTCRMSRGGMKKDFAWSTRERGGEPGDLHAWKTIVKALPLYHSILSQSSVTVNCTDGIDLISSTKDKYDYLFYLDPPYLSETRTSKDVYEYEMSTENHEQLLKECINHSGKIYLSGYNSELYNDYLSKWTKIEYAVKNNSGQTKKKSDRVEVLWSN